MAFVNDNNLQYLSMKNTYYGKNNFAEVSKNLDTDLKIILLDH